MDFRSRVGDDRFADLAWTDLQVDPVGSLALAYEHIGLEFPDRSRQAVNRWAGSHQPGAHGQHSYDLAQFGLEPEQVQRRFARYMDTYDSAT
jgi:hypothetical protein